MNSTKIPLHDETIRIQYQNGLSIQEMADRHYVSSRTINRKLKELKVEVEHPFLRKISKEILNNLYIEKNYSIRDISKKYKVSPYLVKKALKRYEISKLNPSKGKGVKNERTRE